MRHQRIDAQESERQRAEGATPQQVRDNLIGQGAPLSLAATVLAHLFQKPKR